MYVRLYVCMRSHVYMSVCLYVRILIIHTLVCSYLCDVMCVFVCTRMHVHIYLIVNAFLFVSYIVWLCMSICKCLYLHVRVFICVLSSKVYIYGHMLESPFTYVCMSFCLFKFRMHLPEYIYIYEWKWGIDPYELTTKPPLRIQLIQWTYIHIYVVNSKSSDREKEINTLDV